MRALHIPAYRQCEASAGGSAEILLPRKKKESKTWGLIRIPRVAIKTGWQSAVFLSKSCTFMQICCEQFSIYSLICHLSQTFDIQHAKKGALARP